MAVYSDIDSDWKISFKGGVAIVEDIHAIDASVRNILGTFLEERVMLPEFGSRIRELLFNPIDDDTAVLIEMEAAEVITLWDDRVEIINVRVDPFEDDNRYEVYIQFKEAKVGEFKEITFTLEGRK